MDGLAPASPQHALSGKLAFQIHHAPLHFVVKRVFGSLGCILAKVTDKAPENSKASERSATNVSTPVTLSTSSLHKNTALGVDRKSVTSKTFTQLITIIKPS